MDCPTCHAKTKVVDTRHFEDGDLTIRKMRCSKCGAFSFSRETHTDTEEGYAYMNRFHKKYRESRK